jgi:endoplasmic reticulum junction formation protein lunapark
MKQQRVKVDEIKKKTNYNRTRDLLSRYDEMNSAAPGTPESVKQRPQQQNQPLPNQNVFSTPQQQLQQRRQPGSPQQCIYSHHLTERDLLANLFICSVPMLPSSPPPPSGPIRKTWFDKVADAVLGGEDDVARYALICEKCFAHNGLVKENALEETR